MIRVFSDPEGLSRAAAEEVVRIAREAIAARNRFALVLTGGSTPRRLYETLAGKVVPWDRVEFFWGDERAGPPTDARSNYAMAVQSLLRHLDIGSSHAHRMRAEHEDLDAAAEEYESEIARAFGLAGRGEPPPFDLVLLGLGTDGHTASLFPGTQALREQNRWVVPSRSPAEPCLRLTLTPPILNAACHTMFLVAGAHKARVLADVIEGAPDPSRLPAQLIQPRAEPVMWFVDRAAAVNLRRSAIASP